MGTTRPRRRPIIPGKRSRFWRWAGRAGVADGGGAGARAFRRIVVATDVDPPASPCGACRQLLAEFGLDLEVISVGPRTERRWVLRDLLPDAFAKTALSP